MAIGKKKNNPLIKQPTKNEETFFDGKPTWYKGAHQLSWYERIDEQTLYEQLGEDSDILDLIFKLIDYVRIRDAVIEHRHAVMYHADKLINVIMRDETLHNTSLYGKLWLVSNYLSQMTVSPATDPMPPNRELPDRREIPGSK